MVAPYSSKMNHISPLLYFLHPAGKTAWLSNNRENSTVWLSSLAAQLCCKYQRRKIQAIWQLELRCLGTKRHCKMCVHVSAIFNTGWGSWSSWKWSGSSFPGKARVARVYLEPQYLSRTVISLTTHTELKHTEIIPLLHNIITMQV